MKKNNVGYLKKYFAVILPLLILVSFFGIIKISNTPHSAELRFSEKSQSKNILGKMVPASCESGGNGLRGPDHVTACSWNVYCAGASSSAPWRHWRHSNDDSEDDEPDPVNVYCGPEVQVNFP